MTSAGKRKGITRRSFLGYAGAGALGGTISFLLGIPLVGSFLSPVLVKKREVPEEWVELGKVKDFTPGEPKVVQWVVTVMDGWMSEPTARSAWVYTPDGQNFVVWNPHCTHLGCAVGWKTDHIARTSGVHQGHFFSPCHDGVYELVGLDTRVIGGPPPRPLDTMPLKIENGKLYCVYREFRKGIAEKIEI